MAFSTKATSGIVLSIIKIGIAWTLMKELKTALRVAGRAGLDSTNMARERLETQAQEKSAKRGVHSREPSICIFLSCGASYYKITARYGGVKPTVLLKGRRKKKNSNTNSS
jgi:hypothetical protein